MKEIEFTTKEAWLTEREKGVGGSDVCVLMGCSSYRTPLDVYNDKIGMPEPELDEATKQRFLRGHIFEKATIEWYNETQKNQCKHYDKIIWVSDEDPIFRCSPDAVIETEDELDGLGLMECKSYANYYADQPKLDAYCQLQWGLGISGMQWGEIVWINSQFIWAIKPFEFDKQYFEKQKLVASQFYENHVIPRIPPPPLTAYDSIQLYPDALLGKTVLPPEDYSQKVMEYAANNRKMKEIRGEQEKIKTEFILEFKDAETMVAEDGCIIATYKNMTRKEYIVKELQTRRLNIKNTRSL